MKISAELNNFRMAPRKVRLVANAIRGKSLPEAERALRFLTRRAAGPMTKLLRSAVANAKNNFQVREIDSLIISELTVGGGPTLKRRRPRAMGRAFPIRKRTSHVRLVLETSAAPERVKGKKPEIKIVGADESGKGEEMLTPRQLASPPLRRSGLVVSREKPKVETKPKEFVRRMFRRKAI